MTETELLTLAEAAKLLRISPVTLRDWLRAGIVKGVKVGRGMKGRWRVPASAIERSVRDAVPALSEEDLDYTVAALESAHSAAGIYVSPGSTRNIVLGIERPAPMFWKLLADGIRALTPK